MLSIRRVWKYQTGNQNPYIEEEQTTQSMGQWIKLISYGIKGHFLAWFKNNLLERKKWSQEVRLYHCRMFVKALCLLRLYVCQGSMFVKALCLSRLYVCQGYMFVKALCLLRLYVCQGSMFVKALCLSRLYVCQGSMFVKAICLSMLYVCQCSMFVKALCYRSLLLSINTQLVYQWYLWKTSSLKKVVFRLYKLKV
jgi:hypothetical protein